MKCQCKDVSFGTYDVTVPIINPFNQKIVDIDACVLTEVCWLWKLGIQTIESCCGHNKADGYIAVKNSHIHRMRDLGYVEDNRTESPGVFLRRGEWFLEREANIIEVDGEKIRKAREAKGLSRRELCRIININYGGNLWETYLDAIENGRTNTKKYLQALCDILEIDIK